MFFWSPKILVISKSSISISPTNHNSFSHSFFLVIKSNDSKPTCSPSWTPHFSPLVLKSSNRLFQSSTPTSQSFFSLNQNIFVSTSLFQVSELPFQRNVTATLSFAIFPWRSSTICMFLLNSLFSLILLTCLYYLILNFKVFIYILPTVLVFIKFCANSAGVLFRLIESNRSW